jgi:tetratricopeptide (TPR) repeat protein
MSVRFCPQCGTQTVPSASFCAACGEALPGAQKTTLPRSDTSTVLLQRPLTAGLVVLSLYLVVGIGLWVFVLRSQPFPTASAPASGEPTSIASTGGSVLPQGHPPMTLPDEAKQQINELVAQADVMPQNIAIWKRLAEVQFRASQLDASYRSAALSSYRHILELAPDDLEALRGTGNVYYDLEEHAKAIAYYQQYLALKPDDPSVRTDMATMHLYSGDTDGAIAEYQAVLAVQPRFFQAHFNLGIAYQEKGEKEKARAALGQARTLATDETVRARIDQIIARFNNGTGAASTTAAALSPFQQQVEQLFRSHEIMGPRIARIEWPAPAAARVLVQNFPMAAMPPEIRARFLDKLRAQVSEAQTANGLSGAAAIDIIDADTQELMETISTETS